MRAIFARGYGNAEVLQIRNIDKPMPKENEVLVKIFASSATRADGMMLSGKPYIGRLFTGIRKPKHPVPGTGFSGVIESIGSKVSDFQIGDRVFGETTLGFSTNAEFVTVPERGSFLKCRKDEVSPRQLFIATDILPLLIF